MTTRLLITVALALGSVSTFAATQSNRTYTITNFERIRVMGPFVVDLKTGKAPSAIASGSSEAIDRLSLSVQGQMLVIKTNNSAWGGWPGKIAAAPRITVTVPNLRSASVEGSGSLSIDKVKGQRINLAASGSGMLSVAALEADQLDVNLLGDAKIKVGGRAQIGRIYARGSSSLEGDSLRVSNLTMNWDSAGNAGVAGGTTAKVTSVGTGDVIVSGTPACTVEATGAGTVRCGKSQ